MKRIIKNRHNPKKEQAFKNIRAEMFLSNNCQSKDVDYVKALFNAMGTPEVLEFEKQIENREITLMEVAMLEI